MKADPFQIGDVLKDQRRFIVPIYQRTHAWRPARQLITLDDTDDSPAIFETLNSGRDSLAAMDLVRNDAFRRAMRRNEDVDALMDGSSVFEDRFRETRDHGRSLPAEHYAALKPLNPYIVTNDAPKANTLKEAYPALYKE